jgi:hypothetical protein
LAAKQCAIPSEQHGGDDEGQGILCIVGPGKKARSIYQFAMLAHCSPKPHYQWLVLA